MQDVSVLTILLNQQKVSGDRENDCDRIQRAILRNPINQFVKSSIPAHHYSAATRLHCENVEGSDGESSVQCSLCVRYATINKSSSLGSSVAEDLTTTTSKGSIDRIGNRSLHKLREKNGPTL